MFIPADILDALLISGIAYPGIGRFMELKSQRAKRDRCLGDPGKLHRNLVILELKILGKAAAELPRNHMLRLPDV
jgi:hypothetical protein